MQETFYFFSVRLAEIIDERDPPPSNKCQCKLQVLGGGMCQISISKYLREREKGKIERLYSLQGQLSREHLMGK